MKLNNLRAIFPSSGYKNRILSYPVVIGVSVVLFCLTVSKSGGPIPEIFERFLITNADTKYTFEYFNQFKGLWSSDSFSYFYAGDKLLEGHIDCSRTPVYPLFIKFASLIGGRNNTYLTLSILQYLIFICSALILIKIGLKFTSNHKTTFWITTLYLIIPEFCVFSAYVLTESLSISFTIFLIWFSTRHLPSKFEISDALLTGLILFILVYLRPIFICLLPVYILYYLLLIFECRKLKSSSFIGLASILLIIGSIGVYRNEMKRLYGLNSITWVSSINNFCTARQTIGIHPELTSNQSIHDALVKVEAADNEDIFEDTKILFPIICENKSDFEEYTNALMRYSVSGLAKGILYRSVYDASNYRLFFEPTFFPINMLFTIVNPNMAVYWILIIWISVILVYKSWRRRQVPIIFSLLWMITLSISVASYVGAMAEWTRLIAPGIPAFMLLVGKLCGMYNRRDDVELV